MPSRQSVDFNIASAPREVTNPLDPTGAGVGAPYPKHLYKHVAKETSKSLVVAYDGDEPIHNEFVEVGSQAQEDDYVAKGYSVKPVLKAKK